MPRRPLLTTSSVSLAVAATLFTAGPGLAASPKRLELVPTGVVLGDEAREGPNEASLDALRQAVAEAPRDRAARYALVRGLMDAQDWPGALEAARAWRAHDAYDLVVVRLIGDIYRELGREDDALRTYSAVTELLAEDPEAQRALATVLKQRGDLEAARGRLVRAVALRPEDGRLAFELADVELRLGRLDDARARLERIVLGDVDDAAGGAETRVPEQVRYPAKQRLAQLYGAQRRDAEATGDHAAAAEARARLVALDVKGGTDNDIKIFLSWDTNRTDVDLWVTTPTGERIWYQHRKGKQGASLYDDVTSGYGPESFTAPVAADGTYEIHVNYYGTSRARFVEARGEVIVVLDEGRPTERQVVLPYVLSQPKQTVEIAKIDVATP